MMSFAIWLQESGSLSAGNSRLLMFFVGMVAIAMVTQAIVVIAAVIGAAKARKQLLGILEEIKLKTVPVIEGTQNVINDLQPKVRTIADNLVETSHMFRSKVQEVDATISDVNHRARAQTERVDDMVSSVLNTTSDIASTITRGVQVPVREFHGVMSGLKAGLDVLTGRNNHRSPQSSHETPDL